MKKIILTLFVMLISVSLMVSQTVQEKTEKKLKMYTEKLSLTSTQIPQQLEAVQQEPLQQHLHLLCQLQHRRHQHRLARGLLHQLVRRQQRNLELVPRRLHQQEHPLRHPRRQRLGQ